MATATSYDTLGRPRYLGATVWMTKEERLRIRQEAAKYGLTASEFMRVTADPVDDRKARTAKAR